ncbi:MAG: sugar isomerase, partial [Thermotoga sp.]
MEKKYELLAKDLKKEGIDVDDILKKLDEIRFELPSWSFGDTGTRFAVFHEPGAAR